MTFLERGKKPTSNETWNPDTKILRVETNHPLGKIPQEVDIAVNVGDISVTGVESPTSTLKTTLTISADSEKVAREELAYRKKSFDVKQGRGRLRIDGRKEQDVILEDDGATTFVRPNDAYTLDHPEAKVLRSTTDKKMVVEQGNQCEVFDGKDIIVTANDPRKMTFDGKPLDPDNPQLIPLPTVRREVDLLVPNVGEGKYDLTTQVGRVYVGGLNGEADIRANFSGSVTVDGFEGEMKIANYGGETNVSNFTGNLQIQGEEKDVNVDTFRGKAPFIETDNGNITVKGAVFLEDSSLNTKSGDVTISAKNEEDLIVRAETFGRILVPKTDEFELEYHKAPKKRLGKKRELGGRLTNPESSREDLQLQGEGNRRSNELEINSETGNIIISQDK